MGFYLVVVVVGGGGGSGVYVGWVGWVKRQIQIGVVV